MKNENIFRYIGENRVENQNVYFKMDIRQLICKEIQSKISSRKKNLETTKTTW